MVKKSRRYRLPPGLCATPLRRDHVKDRTPAQVLSLCKDEGVEFVDYRFCDLPGIMQHVTVPASALEESTFEDGHGFDGSSIRGFQQIQESDMILLPDPTTAYIDPFRAR